MKVVGVKDNIKSNANLNVVVEKNCNEFINATDNNKTNKMAKEVLACLLRDLYKKLKEKRSGK